MNDEFELYDLAVSIEGDPASFVCSHTPGKAFTVHGEDLVFESATNQFSLYALSALLPLLPAKQRPLASNDWMHSDDVVACPDPNCGATFRLTQADKVTFKHHETTEVPLKKDMNL